jgi:hypothetical protein
VFSEADRKIFPFHDGERERKADPLAVKGRLHKATGGRMQAHLKALQLAAQLSGAAEMSDAVAADLSDKTFEAAEVLSGAVRSAFGVQPFDGGGLTDGECLDLLGRFIAYVADLEEQHRPLPSAPPSTECPAASATPSSLDSTLTVTEA